MTGTEYWPAGPRTAGESVEPVNIAVVGLGYWGPNLTRALFEVDNVHVPYVCDLDEQRLDRLATRYPSVTPTRELDEVLDDPSVDAVVVATPVFTHFDLASRCLEADKHVLVEKPLAPSTSKANALMDLADERDLTLMCGHTFVYSPPVRAVKD